MDIVADLHVHTVASGHAFSTLQEIVHEANSKGVKIFGIADHGPCVAGAPSFHYFRSLKFIPRYLDGVMVLRGAEANIVNVDGLVDVPEHCLKRLDYAMAGFHAIKEYADKDIATNTKAVINVMDNPYIRIITHPGNPKYPIDHEAVVRAAKKKNVALEINNASFVSTREGSKENCQHLAALIKEYDAYTVIGSDAHISYDLANFNEALKIVDDIGIKKERVINSKKELMFEFLGIDV